ncbi:MAG TPA: hypothetical protein VLB80_04910 [Candidatus Babeliales bacterium]|nr:hypothetical protein [Candidatus Babeliales bacterium]
MFLDSVGIILRKNNLSRYKIVILDKIQGKIECVTLINSLSPGALIAYNIREKNVTNFISDSELLYLPLSLAQTDMLFFHHVLELVYYFTEIGSCSNEVFDILAFLYSTFLSAMTIQSKKLFLLKLLTSTGSIPELNTHYSHYIMHLSTIDIKQLVTMTIDISYEKELDKWLWCCVQQHPYANEFKTVHFLAQNRTL